jgi:hypothetical protein
MPTDRNTVNRMRVSLGVGIVEREVDNVCLLYCSLDRISYCFSSCAELLISRQ